MPEWYRRYHGTCADPKFRLVAREANVPTPFAGFAWDAILEHCSSRQDRGTIEGMTPELLAVTVDISEDEAGRIIAAFEKRGMIVNGLVRAWEKRNPSDATAAERMRRFRDREKERRTGAGEYRSRMEAKGRMFIRVANEVLSEDTRAMLWAEVESRLEGELK